MSGENKSTNIMEELSKTVEQINELLGKSSAMYKNEEMPEEEAAAPAEVAPEMEAAPEAEAAAETAEPPMDEAAAAEQAAPEMEAGAEQAQGEDQWEAEMAQHAQEMSDEELDKLLEMLMAEKEARSASQEGEMAPEGAEAGEQAAPEMEAPAEEEPQFEEAEKSMKEDFLKLSKSLDMVLEKIGGLSAKVEKIESVAPAKKTVSKPAASNRQVQVLEKSNKPAESVARLTKSESIEFLLGEMKKGNQLVDSRVITDFSYAQSQDEVNELQKSMAKRGLEFPKI